jgi:Cu(I)/Ag(I) efflux system membrane fusion protein/cobalt-zinc-cadmium efflux system membrane fusion protein
VSCARGTLPRGALRALLDACAGAGRAALDVLRTAALAVRTPAPVVLAALAAALPLAAGGAASAAEPAHVHTAAEEKQLYTCGMHPQVIREEPGLCPICGMELTPLRKAASAPASGERRVLYWWDPMMSPPYISDRPGKSPMGMDLVPVYEDEARAGEPLVIDPTIVQNMGVRVATAEEGPLRRTIRAAGYLAEAEPNQHDVDLRVSGWIEKLYANVEGMHVNAGAPLFDLYSPELQVAIEELIAARRASGALAEGPRGGSARDDEVTFRARDALLATAERKLLLLGIPPEQVRELGRLGRAPRTVTFSSPVTGHVVEKPIVEGSAVEAGTRALRIVDHSSLWLDIALFEQQLPFVRLGQPIQATVLAFPGQVFRGTIGFLHPHVDMKTRTATARIVVKNDVLQLRPGMFASVEFQAEIAPRALLVPLDAVIDTGKEQVVFVARPQGHFEPRRVTKGPTGSDGRVQILSGLAPGEQVVTSGQFLLDAESRFREAIAKFLKKDLLVDAPAARADSTPAPAEDAR